MCTRCRSYSLDPANKMAPLGFGRCRHLDVWHYRSRHAPGFRSAANCQENLAYPQRILTRLEPIYVRAGWGPGVCA